MGKIVETTIDDFTGGVTTEGRTKDQRKARAIKHFDILSQQDRLIPHRRFETDTFNSNLSATQGSLRLVKFLTYATSQSGTIHFGLGINDGSGIRLFYRGSTTNPATFDNFAHDQWNGDTASTGALNENLFVEYRGIAYAARANEIVQWTLDVTSALGSSTFASARSLTFSNIFQGLVHSKDDVLYIPYVDTTSGYIASYNGSAWNDTALTLPRSTGKIDICEFGNYLGVALQPKFYGGHSYAYLWDRNSSLPTLSEKIDWGTEDLQIIEELDGYLIGISIIGNAIHKFSISGRVIFKAWDGRRLVDVLTLDTGDRAISIVGKQKENNRIYFLMSVNINGAWHEGLWSFGRNKTGQFALALEYQLNNDTQVSSVALKGFHIVGDYVTISYTDTGTYTLKITDDAATFSDTSIFETKIFNGGDPSLKKDLRGITITTEPLDDSPAGQVLVRYITDAGTSWTTLLTHDTYNAISASASGSQSSPAVFPKDYKEIRFRLESTGSAVITGFSFQEEITGKLPYKSLKE